MVYVEQKGHVHSVSTVFVFVLPGEGGDHHDAKRGNIRGNSSNMERNCVQSHSDGSGLQCPRDSAVCYRGTDTHTHTHLLPLLYSATAYLPFLSANTIFVSSLPPLSCLSRYVVTISRPASSAQEPSSAAPPSTCL